MSKAKSETKPRGRMTAYAFFVQICREEHKKNHPDEHVAFADFSKKCAERWKVSDFNYSVCGSGRSGAAVPSSFLNYGV